MESLLEELDEEENGETFPYFLRNICSDQTLSLLEELDDEENGEKFHYLLHKICSEHA